MRHEPDSTGTLRPALVATAVSLLMFGLAYPAAVVMVGRAAFPAQARGSLIERDGRAIGSDLVGQRFEGNGYLTGRPSAVGYDPAAVAGSNLAPSHPALREAVAARARAIADREIGAPTRLPVDALTASGAGIDPHISPAYAELQVARIALARGIAPQQVREVIARHTRMPTLGVLGQPRVHVLGVNLALDDSRVHDESPAP
ncbi:potassium-transporting ATPase subunit KdpC [Sinimarinibacterium flocculans]|mgnify:CR=1 FL=1|uniref:Potassium-transporting ATPase KdpC subunit n=1 Tax=Sinimarinibacterium flocculans TaxID=985250 RepID=A0A318E5D5_9GAMM|nr:potassium-transporting ATPase subunit KdpC [Sinimarinibacterium flocculans]PXV65288.1 K+-transporting ATPase ATPase C chain [Sinimarinibacterium flocculans]